MRPAIRACLRGVVAPPGASSLEFKVVPIGNSRGVRLPKTVPHVIERLVRHETVALGGELRERVLLSLGLQGGHE